QERLARQDRVSGVVAALAADDEVGRPGQEIGRLPLALVAPLGSDQDRDRHGRILPSAPRRPDPVEAFRILRGISAGSAGTFRWPAYGRSDTEAEGHEGSGDDGARRNDRRLVAGHRAGGWAGDRELADLRLGASRARARTGARWRPAGRPGDRR